MSREPLALAGLLGLAMAALPLVVAPWLLTQLAQYLCYGLLAMSLAYVWGQGGILSFGQAIFFGLGAYAYGLVTLALVPGLPASPWLGLVLAIVVPVLAAGAFGAMLFAGRGIGGAPLAAVTLASGVIAERLAVNSTWLGGSNGLIGVPPPGLSWGARTFELYDPLPLYLVMLAVAALIHAGLAWLIRSPFGMMLRAVREDELRAAHLGITPWTIKLRALMIAAAIAGLGGALFAAQFGFVGPPLLGFALSTEVLVWTALGGRGSPLAALLGVLLVRSVESRLAEELGALWLVAIGLLFVLVTVAFPRGLLGEPMARLMQRRRHFHRRLKRPI